MPQMCFDSGSSSVEPFPSKDINLKQNKTTHHASSTNKRDHFKFECYISDVFQD